MVLHGDVERVAGHRAGQPGRLALDAQADVLEAELKVRVRAQHPGQEARVGIRRVALRVDGVEADVAAGVREVHPVLLQGARDHARVPREHQRVDVEGRIEL